MANIVEEILKRSAEKEAKFPSTDVEKSIELSIDEGNLLAVDHNPLDIKEFKSAKDRYLHCLARDDAQLLINALWKLPHERKDDVILAKLPEPTTRIPREKPIPKDRPSTRWQEFARLKGIQNRKKGRMVWDEATKDWRPRWGYNRAGDGTKDWMIEVPDHADPYEDQFEKRQKAKSERVAKNELQRLRNIARSQKSKVPGVGITPSENPSKENLHRALTLAKRSTASVGKFTETLPKEQPAKGMAKKRKFESNIGDFASERKRQMDILRGMGKDKPSLNVTKAVNRHMMEEDTQNRNQKPGRAGVKGKKRSLAGGKGGKSGKYKAKPGGGGGKPGGGGKGKPSGGKGKFGGKGKPTGGKGKSPGGKKKGKR